MNGKPTYIVVMRNPRTNKLFALQDGDDDSLLEFESEESAYDAAQDNNVCVAWGAEIVPVLRDKKA